MKRIVYIFLFTYSCSVLAQDAKVDFKKINEMYYNTNELMMDIKYELYLDNASTPHETETGRYKKQKNSYALKQTDQEVVVNEKYILVIDGENKVIAIDRVGKNSQVLNPLKMNIDSLFILYSKVQFYKAGKNGESNAYHFELKDGIYSSVDIIFNPKTYFVEQIINVFRNKIPDENNIDRKAIFKTIFYNINTKPNFKNDFSEKMCLKENNGKWTLTDSYKNYKLINHIN